MTDTVDLKPCPNPWCEGDPGANVGLNISIGGKRYFYISCDVCQIEGPTRETEVEAITAWNTRQSDADKAKLVGILNRLLGQLILTAEYSPDTTVEQFVRDNRTHMDTAFTAIMGEDND